MKSDAKPENAAPVVDIVIPVYNEEAQLAQSVITLRQYLLQNFHYSWRITIADNASKDQTWQIAKRLEQNYPGEVKALHLDQKGRGRALRYAWACSDAQLFTAYRAACHRTQPDCYRQPPEPRVQNKTPVQTRADLTGIQFAYKVGIRAGLQRCPVWLQSCPQRPGYANVGPHREQ